MTSGVLAPSGSGGVDPRRRGAEPRPRCSSPSAWTPHSGSARARSSSDGSPTARTRSRPTTRASSPSCGTSCDSPLLGLLLVAATASYFVGEQGDAVIIGVIVVVSVGLGFVNEYRAEKAAAALHSQISHEAVVLRDGASGRVDVTALVPGDVVELSLGESCPPTSASCHVAGLECDESVLTGESLPVEKTTDAGAAEAAALADSAGAR